MGKLVFGSGGLLSRVLRSPARFDSCCVHFRRTRIHVDAVALLERPALVAATQAFIDGDSLAQPLSCSVGLRHQSETDGVVVCVHAIWNRILSFVRRY